LIAFRCFGSNLGQLFQKLSTLARRLIDSLGLSIDVALPFVIGILKVGVSGILAFGFRASTFEFEI